MPQGTDRLYKVGRILKSNGTDGELLVGFQGIGLEDIDIKDPVYVFFDGLPVPFFILSIKEKGSRAIVRLNDVNSLKDAEEMAGKDIWAVGDEEEEDGGLEGLCGWTLEDEKGRKVGEIVDFEDIPGNPCLYVETGGGEMMVPLHEDLILDVDNGSRILRMTLPEGLL